MIERDDQQLQADLDQRLLKVLEQQVVVGHAERADRVIIAHGVEERREQRQRVPVLGAGEVLDPLVGQIIVHVGGPVHGLTQARQQQLQQLTPSRLHLRVPRQRVSKADAGLPNVLTTVDVRELLGLVRPGLSVRRCCDCEVWTEQKILKSEKNHFRIIL